MDKSKSFAISSICLIRKKLFSFSIIYNNFFFIFIFYNKIYNLLMNFNKYLPQNVVYCKKCVQSNQRPNTSPEFKKTNTRIGTLSFDDDQICHACKYYSDIKNKIDWKERENELLELLKKYRDKNKQYDILVPGSGGKDSIFVAHILKEKYDMRPLTVTWAPNMYTNVGWENLQKWIKLGFDNILITPNSKIHSKLTRLSFVNLINPFQPFIIGQKNLAPKIAAKYDIKLIMYGENNAEVHNNMNQTISPIMNPKHYSLISEDEPFFLGGCNPEELKKEGITQNDMEIYKPALKDYLSSKEIEVHFMSHYFNWSPHDNYYYVKKICNFESNPDGRSEGTYTKFASLDDKIDGQHYFTMHIKFGHGRCTNDACRDIRDGYINRDEAVQLVKKYDGEFPKKYFKEFLEYINISENKYWEIIDNARPKHLWKKDGNKWTLKNPII